MASRFLAVAVLSLLLAPALAAGDDPFEGWSQEKVEKHRKRAEKAVKKKRAKAKLREAQMAALRKGAKKAGKKKRSKKKKKKKT